MLRSLLCLALMGLPSFASAADDTARRWQPGDHHVHSEWSVDWDRTTSPPTPIRGGDSPYTRSDNARQAQKFGLTWMVHTDHGGPGHSVVTRDHAFPALEQARRDVPALIQFNGMEFDVPAAEHASLIIAPGARERDELVVSGFVLDPNTDLNNTFVAGCKYRDGQTPWLFPYNQMFGFGCAGATLRIGLKDYDLDAPPPTPPPPTRVSPPRKPVAAGAATAAKLKQLAVPAAGPNGTTATDEKAVPSPKAAAATAAAAPSPMNGVHYPAVSIDAAVPSASPAAKRHRVIRIASAEVDTNFAAIGAEIEAWKASLMKSSLSSCALM